MFRAWSDRVMIELQSNVIHEEEQLEKAIDENGGPSCLYKETELINRLQ